MQPLGWPSKSRLLSTWHVSPFVQRLCLEHDRKIKLSSPQQTLHRGVDWDSAAGQCSLSELPALVPRWVEEQDLPLGSLFRSAWQATQLALKFSILTSYPGSPSPAGNGSAERRRERNGNASTAGRAARPPPATVENTALLEDGRGPDPEALTTDIRQKRGGAEMRWGDKGSSCDAAGFLSNKVTRYLIPFTWSLVSSMWSVRGPQAPVPTN